MLALIKKNKILRHPIEIRKHNFASKKEALLFYKTILNSYEFEENLSERDLVEVLA